MQDTKDHKIISPSLAYNSPKTCLNCSSCQPQGILYYCTMLLRVLEDISLAGKGCVGYYNPDDEPSSDPDNSTKGKIK